MSWQNQWICSGKSRNSPGTKSCLRIYPYHLFNNFSILDRLTCFFFVFDLDFLICCLISLIFILIYFRALLIEKIIIKIFTRDLILWNDIQLLAWTSKMAVRINYNLLRPFFTLLQILLILNIVRRIWICVVVSHGFKVNAAILNASLWWNLCGLWIERLILKSLIGFHNIN